MTNEDMRRVRKAKGMTQAQLAEAIGYSRQAIIKWENSVHPIPESIVALVLSACMHAREPKKTKAEQAHSDQVVKDYRNMRRDGFSHLDIITLWHKHDFVPPREAQLAIVAEFEELKGN